MVKAAINLSFARSLTLQRSKHSGKAAMQRAEPADAFFVYSDTDSNANTIILVDMFPEADVASEEIVGWLQQRAERIPNLRESLVQPYGKIGDCYWSEPRRLDVAEHLSVADAENWSELRRALKEELATPFDTERPLWQILLFRNVNDIPGLHGPHFVIATKYHHAMGEPGYFERITRALYSLDLPPAPLLVRPTSRLRITVREAVRLPIRPVLVCIDLIRATKAHRAMLTRQAEVGVPLSTVDRCSITGPLADGVDLDTLVYPLSRLRAAASTYSVSVNDVLMSAIGAAIADHVPDLRTEQIRSFIAISIRDGDTTARNAIAGGLVALPTDLPLSDRLRSIHQAIRAQRSIATSTNVQSSLPRAPGFAYIWSSRHQQRASDASDVVSAHTRVSSVPPPDTTGWQVCGVAPVARFCTTAPGASCGLCHVVTVFNDSAAINVLVDPTQMPDIPGYTARLLHHLDAMTESALPPAGS